jgi:hypothetical protein
MTMFELVTRSGKIVGAKVPIVREPSTNVIE